MGSINENRVAVDRISNLPDNLLAHIFSFLSTEDVLRTSTLSRHWLREWTLITHLEFDDGLLIMENSRLIDNPNPRRRKGFVNFVYRVLLYKVTPLESFRLRCGVDYHVLNVSQWISAALSRNVRVIDLWAPLNGRSLNHEGLFSSTTLVVLTLGTGFVLKVPETFSLKSLRSLHLHNLGFEDSESLSRLVSGCPALKEFKIEGILWDNFDVRLNMSSPTLESLIVVGLYFHPDSEIDGPRSYEVVLNTPSLQYLKHDDNGVPYGYHIESTLHCLDEAWLCLDSSTQNNGDDDSLIVAGSISDLAVAISNVRVLFLSEYTFEAFYLPERELPNFQLPIFPRLTKLDIGDISEDIGLSLLTKFLRSSPQLTSLSFALEKKFNLNLWHPPTYVSPCMLCNLKVIEVVFYRDPEPMLSMVKYFFEKTKCLEELRISFMNQEFIEEVSLLQWASDLCQIVRT